MKIPQAILIAIILVASATAQTSKTAAAVSTLRKSHPAATWNIKTAIVADVTCTGKPDVVILGSERNNVLVGVVPESHASRPLVLSFPKRRATQDSFCAFPTRIESWPLDCESEQGSLPGCKPVKGCKEFSVADDECDPFNFYWDSSQKTLKWWRH